MHHFRCAFTLAPANPPLASAARKLSGITRETCF
jgi:hypothetical protein